MSTEHLHTEKEKEKEHEGDMLLLKERPNLFGRFFSWYWPTSEELTLRSELEILKYVKTPIRRRLVDIGGNKINTLEVGSHQQDVNLQHQNKTLVLAAGYACGVGHFFKNLEDLGNQEGLKTYVIDWLGTGRSSRPEFNFKPEQEGSVEAAENFFIDSLEKWRKEQKIEKMILGGHSLGGYLMASYAMKYPERVEHLILISPVGVPEKPKNDERSRSLLYKTAIFFWDLNITPQSVVRTAGRAGPKLINTYIEKRFDYLDEDDKALLHNYTYHISAQKGSGEYALNVILSPGAWARKPLINRIHTIQSPTTFIYGQYDWMDANAGRECCKILKEAEVKTISNAGHHLQIDNP